MLIAARNDRNIHGRCDCGGILHQRTGAVVLNAIRHNIPPLAGTVLCDRCDFSRQADTPAEYEYAEEVRAEIGNGAYR